MKQTRVKMADIASDDPRSRSESTRGWGNEVGLRHSQGARLHQPVLKRGGAAQAPGLGDGHLLHRLRPHGREPARGPPAAAHEHGAPAEGGAQAHRARRRRDNAHRRPLGKVRDAEDPSRGDHRGERRAVSRADRAFPGLQRGKGPHAGQRRMAGAAELHRVPARHRQALLGQPHADLRDLQDAPRDGTVVHRVQLPAPAVLRLPGAVPPPRLPAADGRG